MRIAEPENTWSQMSVGNGPAVRRLLYFEKKEDLYKRKSRFGKKAILQLEEAAAYSGIGINELRQLTNDEDCEFVLWLGTKRLIKRRKFDEYIEKLYAFLLEL